MIKVLVYLAIACLALTLAKKEFKFGMLYSDPIVSSGWTANHEIARGELEELLLKDGYLVTSEVCEYCTPIQGWEKMLLWAQNKFNVIFATSVIFKEDVTSFVKLGHSIPIIGIGSIPPGKDVVSVIGKSYQGVYLLGMMCALVSKTGKIGYQTFTLTSNQYNQINSFYLGAKKIRPQVQMSVVLTGSFYDPLIEYKTGQYMIDKENIDCAAGTDQFARAFQERGLVSEGLTDDIRYTVGEHVFISLKSYWTHVYYDLVKNIINGTFPQNTSIFGDIDYIVKISAFSPLVPPDIKEVIFAEKLRLVNAKGEEVIFCGEEVRKILRYSASSWPSSGCLSQNDIRFLKSIPSDIRILPTLTREDVIEVVSIYGNGPLPEIYVYLTISSILCLAMLGLLGHILIYRNNDQYRKASFRMCFIIVLGSLLGIISVFLWAEYPNPRSCIVRIWLPALAIVIVYGTLIAKNYRIYRFMYNKMLNKPINISDKDILLKALLPATIVEIIILSLTTALDPWLSKKDSSSYLREDQVFLRCRSESIVGLIVIVLVNLLFILGGALVSWKTRNIDPKFREYKESEQIGNAIITTFLALMLGVFFSITLPYSPRSEYSVISLISLWIFSAPIFFVILPKSYYIHFPPQEHKSSLFNTSPLPTPSPNTSTVDDTVEPAPIEVRREKKRRRARKSRYE